MAVADKAWRIDPLSPAHDRKGFSCGNTALDRYIQQQARQDTEKRVAAPFVLTEPPALRVLGYYTLSASVIDVRALPQNLTRKLPRYPQLPVTLLGRLAVDESASGRGIAAFLLMDALRRSLEAATDIAAMAVVVDAKDDAAEGFYRHFSFLPLQSQPRRLFLAMKAIAGLFSD